MPSNVWNYFIKCEKTVKCNICCKQLTHNSSSTGNMLNHLKLMHPTIKLPGDAGKETQPTIRDLFKKQMKCDKKRTEKITTLIRQVLIDNLLPFKLVESESFKQLISFLVPEYDIPSRVSFSNQIKKEYEDKKIELKKIVPPASVFLTTDAWMSLNTESFTTVTAHFITEDWMLRSVVLSTMFDKEKHSSENIKLSLHTVIDEYGLDEKIKACVHDNARNVVKACQDSHIIKISVNCAAHSLQLAINKALNDLSHVTAAASRLVGHFKHSYAATSQLQRKQTDLNIPKHKLVQKCPTRWNSTLDMFSRLLEQRWAICAVLSDREFTKISDARTLELRDSHWSIIQDLIPVLEPLKMATETLSADSKVTISCVMPILHSLMKRHLEESDLDNEIVKKFKNTTKMDLKERFADIFREVSVEDDLSVYVLATFLDPRHKHFPFNTDEEKQVIHDKVKAIVKTLEDKEKMTEVPCNRNEGRCR